MGKYMKLRDMTVKAKLAMGFFTLAALVIALAALALHALGRGNQSFEHYTGEVAARQALVNEVLSATDARAISARNLVLVTTAADRDSEKLAVTRAHERVSSALGRLKDLLAKSEGVSEQERSLFKDIESTEMRYGSLALNIVGLALNNQQEQAIAKMNNECRPLLATLVKQVDAYVAYGTAQAAGEVQASGATYVSSRNWMVGGCVLAVALALGLALLITKSITLELGGEPAQAVRVAREIAQGNLTTEVPCRAGADSSLMAAMATMRDNLVRTVSEVRRNADGVSVASAEIAQGNQDLSQRTENQASALQETASAMEELGSTVSHNADNAAQANQLAQGASAVAVNGGTVVAEVVRTMRGIEESSKKIGDIISVIDGIAFQTNILALNAAVEAARAGEQGRGFAVVAGEVRTLAQRSAEAAKQIKELITDSVQRVSEGSVLADKAGTTMDEVVQSIRRVTDLMGEINSATAEQSKGVAQVGQAVTEMDQATQQNAALVEESAAAAASLRTQAQRLVEAVSVFCVSANDVGAAPSPMGEVAVAKAPHVQGWSGTERRGPQRAANVLRPDFKREAQVAQAMQPVAVGSAVRTGTDQWVNF
jgi:methyl-accepting chemotaxis protein-1 (serine sensor receptor)